jgi:hypothetical protein
MPPKPAAGGSPEKPSVSHAVRIPSLKVLLERVPGCAFRGILVILVERGWEPFLG